MGGEDLEGGFGFHPLPAYVDHGDGGIGEPVAGLLRRGNAGSNTCADHLTVLDDALAQLPERVIAAPCTSSTSPRCSR